MTPRTVERVPGRHGPADHSAAGPREPTAGTGKGTHFWEDTNNNARVALQPAAGHSADAVHPEPGRAAGADRQRIELRHRRARRRLHASTTKRPLEAEWHSEQDLHPRLVHLEPLLRQLRPGRHDRCAATTRTLHRLVQHRRRRGTPALELQERHAARRPPAPAEALRLPRRFPGTPASALFFLAQSGQPWEINGATSRTSPLIDLHERLEPLRRAGRLAAIRLPLAARPELHAELQSDAAVRRPGWPAISSTSSTSRPATTSSRTPTARSSDSRGTTSTRGACRWRRASCSDADEHRIDQGPADAAGPFVLAFRLGRAQRLAGGYGNRRSRGDELSGRRVGALPRERDARGLIGLAAAAR